MAIRPETVACLPDVMSGAGVVTMRAIAATLPATRPATRPAAQPAGRRAE